MQVLVSNEVAKKKKLRGSFVVPALSLPPAPRPSTCSSTHDAQRFEDIASVFEAVADRCRKECESPASPVITPCGSLGQLSGIDELESPCEWRSGSVSGVSDSSRDCDPLSHAFEDPRCLHPIVRAARRENFRAALLVGDLTKSPKLCEHFQRYHLNDFFDDKGQRLYQNLSMSFAAKQHPDIKECFGSSSTTKHAVRTDKKGDGKHLSARAYRLATEMVQKDREAIKKKIHEQYALLDDREKNQLQAVQARQHELLFLEVPDYEEYLPPGIQVQSLLPMDVPRAQEREEKRRFEKLNTILLETPSLMLKSGWLGNWLLRHEEVLEVVSMIGAWTLAAGLSSSLGVDRSVFCRFILDVGLVDQDTIPYVWAVSVFDQYARPIRVLSTDVDWNVETHHEGRVPAQPLVSKWDFMSVLDVLLRRRYSLDTRTEFLEKMRSVSTELTAEWQRKEQQAVAAATERAKAMPLIQVEPKVINATLPLGQAQTRVPGSLPTNQMNLGLYDECPPTATVAPRESPRDRGSGSDYAVWKRNQLVNGILCEPEVLQLAEQNRGVFQEFFVCYSEDDPRDNTDGGEGRSKTGGYVKNRGSSDFELSSNMEFVHFLQFCQDFHIVPRIASIHEVLRAYRSAACLVYPATEDKPQVPAPSAAGNTVRRSSVILHLAAEAIAEFLEFMRMIQSKFGGNPDAAFDSWDLDGKGVLSMTEFIMGTQSMGFTGDLKQVFHQLDANKTGSLSRREFRALTQSEVPDISHSEDLRESPACSLRSPGRSVVRESLNPADTTFDRCVIPATQQPARRSRPSNRSTASRLRVAKEPGRFKKAPPPSPSTSHGSSHDHDKLEERKTLLKTEQGPPPPRFGLAAFVETLCRIALTYLLVHGNKVQCASAGRAKMVWLVSYLQCVVTHMRRSHDRRLQGDRRVRIDKVKGISKCSDSCLGSDEDESPHRATAVERRCSLVIAESALPPAKLSAQLARILDKVVDAAKLLLPPPMQLQKEARDDGSSPHSQPQTPSNHCTASSARLDDGGASVQNMSPGRGTTFTIGQHVARRRKEATGRDFRDRLKSVVPDMDVQAHNPEDTKMSEVVRSGGMRSSIHSTSSARYSMASNCMSESGSSTSRELRRTRSGKQGKPREAKQQKDGDFLLDSQANRSTSLQPQQFEPPPLQEDNFRFADLLFAGLLRCSAGLPDPSVNAPSTADLPGGLLCKGGADMRSSVAGFEGDPPASAPSPYRSLGEDRDALQKGLNNCVGKLDRSELTPPPLNHFATSLNSRLDCLIGEIQNEQPVRQHNKTVKHSQNPKHLRLL